MASPDPRRAAAQFAWTEPLRPLRARYRRLAGAAYRMGAIALGATVIVIMARLRTGFGPLWIGITAALPVIGGGGILLGRAAAREAQRLDEEIREIEREAEKRLA